MNAEANLPANAFDGLPFDDFYDRAVPVVYGYLLRLCGGDRDAAWDLTQDTWITVVDRLAHGCTDKATVGFLLAVMVLRFIGGAANWSCQVRTIGDRASAPYRRRASRTSSR
jgi:DNA-directed RNA polymerase specialized sigma24 family protein